MPNIFVTSDTHFSQASFLEFKDEFGNPARPFSSVEEADETMVEHWNAVVSPSDKVYHLGDVAMRKEHLSILARLNGSKRLILGNHDIFDFKDYKPYFKTIYAMRKLEDILLTHIPIHPQQLSRFKLNIHGHLHQRVIDDPRFVNVCVEQTNYTPVDLSVILERIL
jgi:calcineurin-like phosphoesterase family protein